MDPIYIFTLTGAFAMAAALSARQVSYDAMPQSPPGRQDDAQDTSSKQITPVSVSATYLIAGNLAVIALIASVVYGAQNFAWWIPVSSLIVSFPAIYYILLRRMLQPKLGSLVYAGLALVGLALMTQGWIT